MTTTIVPAITSLPRATEFVALSWGAFALWWVVVGFVHFISCVYAAGFAKFYWDFGATLLSYTLEGNNVGMPREDFRTISYVHIVLAAAHGVSLVLMVVGSLWRRTLVFFPWSATKNDEILGMDVSNKENCQSYDLSMNDSSLGRLGTGVLRSGKLLKAKLTYARGVVGVNGRYFYAVLICREIVETAFQTAQAFRMSKYLSSRILNNLYVSLLVLNCWSSAFVHARLFAGDEARRRLAVIVCDCVLDLLSAMGVAVIVVLKYVDQYDTSLEGFGYELQNIDDWMAQMLNEARLVVVSSWSDLVGRVIFSLGFIMTTANMKKLLRWTPRARENRVADAKPTHSSNQIQHLGSIGPMSSASSKDEPNSETNQQKPLDSRFRRCSILFIHIRGRLLPTIHVIFVVWGAVVLALHLQASVKDPLISCNPKVNPMAGALPACYAVEFDCYKLDIAGSKEQVRAEWLRFDRGTTVKLHFLHCIDLEVPEMLKEFSHLLEIWVYNSTIREWGASSAVTNSDHPELVSITVVRTNMTEGYLPKGFQSADFPLGLTQLYFCETNLQFVPDDLDTKLHFGSSIYIENSKLTEVPLALARSRPAFLSFAGNPIVELQPELFEGMGIPYLILSHTNVRELPRNVTEPPTIQAFYDFSFTEIAFFWSWIDPFVELTFLPQISAGGSPYCTDLDKIFSGAATNFSVPFQPEYSRILMNASDANWPALQQYVMCSNPLSSTQFPLDDWDAQYRITNE